jgi:hypothetical protein
MPSRHHTRISVAKQKSVADIVQELWELLRSYATQETIEPLKKLGIYLAWGASGSLLMALGGFFLGMSALRALQTETGDAFVGEFSWVPYFIVSILLCGVIALAVRRIVHYQRREHRKPA